MPDHTSLRPHRVRIELARQQTRCRGSDDHLGLRRAAHTFVQRELQFDALGRARMKFASATHSSTVDTTRNRSCDAPFASPTRSNAGQAFATFARNCASAFGAGSHAVTSSPCARARHPAAADHARAQSAANCFTCMSSCPCIQPRLGELFECAFFQRPLAARRQAELPASFGGRQHACAEPFDDFHRTLHKRTVALACTPRSSQMCLPARRARGR